jgi:ribose transport system permease protein
VLPEIPTERGHAGLGGCWCRDGGGVAAWKASPGAPVWSTLSFVVDRGDFRAFGDPTDLQIQAVGPVPQHPAYDHKAAGAIVRIWPRDIFQLPSCRGRTLGHIRDNGSEIDCKHSRSLVRIGENANGAWSRNRLAIAAPVPRHSALAEHARQAVYSMTDVNPAARRIWAPFKLVHFNQEQIVLAITVSLFIGFCLTLNNFATAGNLISLVQSVAILGVLSVGMSLIIIGRGIDLTMVAVMAMSVGWVFSQVANGMGIAPAFALGFGFALLVGVLNGILIAYVEIPAIFATLAMATLVYGVGHFALVDNDTIIVGDQHATFKAIFAGNVLGVPASILWAALVALVMFLFLRFTKPGRLIYAMGDNPLAARVTGIAVRPMIVLQYAASATIAFLAGLLLTATVSSMNTRLANSTMIYDVILVVVIGGIGLSGGKGGVRNVIVGSLLIGTLFNGMTILDMSFTQQKIIKSLILLIAIVVDSVVNPRDEQTAQQGDI